MFLSTSLDAGLGPNLCKLFWSFVDLRFQFYESRFGIPGLRYWDRLRHWGMVKAGTVQYILDSGHFLVIN